jgi:hypothetical protein
MSESDGGEGSRIARWQFNLNSQAVKALYRQCAARSMQQSMPGPEALGLLTVAAGSHTCVTTKPIVGSVVVTCM